MGALVLFVLPFILTALCAYFLGCFNGAVIVSKYILRDDVRTHGSGNAGLTNFYRTFGGPLTLVVILTDVLKAVLAVLLGVWICLHWPIGIAIDEPLRYYDPVLFQYFAGTFCMIGHMFPCMFHFKGGKGILSGGVVAIMIDWRVALIVWGGFLLLTILTKWVSLGSIYAGTAFPIATWFVFQNPWYTVLAAICGVLILWKHRTNIKRLLKGEESKFALHRKKE